jgi:drug/metabolite transporter (DMT)-like permease
MFAAFLATLLFAGSVTAAGRTTRLLGSDRANFWRVLVATAALGLWAHGWGQGLGGGAPGWFFLSGVVGFGIGDLALYHAFPRLGPRLGALMVNCLAAPFAAVTEWVWLGTRLSAAEVFWSALILGGVGVALAPERGQKWQVSRRQRGIGIACGVIAGLGQGLGAVLSRKGFELGGAAGFDLDGGTAAYQRILGGLLIVGLRAAWLLVLARWSEGAKGEADVVRPPSRRVWPLVLTNAMAGPTIGVACFQWALKTTPAAVVLPIVATTPLVVIPFTWALDGDRPGARSVLGGVVAVAGVIGLTVG